MTSQILNTVLLAWFTGMTGLTYLLFWWDKRCAIRGEWRVSESHLLWFAALGGVLGAKLAQRLFRHKTRKQPFGLSLNLILFMWIAIVLFFMFGGREFLIGLLLAPLQ